MRSAAGWATGLRGAGAADGARRGGLVAAIAQAYRAPRAAMARQVAEGLSEPRATAHLFLACALGFVASMPNAVREAATLEIDDPVSGAVAAHLFGWLFVAPLLGYALAALIHVGARAFGGAGGFLGARSALFWSALLAGPLALALALVGVGAEVAGGPRVLPWLDLLGYAGLAFWLWLLAGSLAETEGFRDVRRVMAALVMSLVAVAVGFRAMAVAIG